MENSFSSFETTRMMQWFSNLYQRFNGRVTQFSVFWNNIRSRQARTKQQQTQSPLFDNLLLQTKSSSNFASRVYMLSQLINNTTICLKCIFSDVKFSLVVQEYGFLLLIIWQFIVKRLIFPDRPHFHETPCIFGRRKRKIWMCCGGN